MYQNKDLMKSTDNGRTINLTEGEHYNGRLLY
jgi:hypothetical protein